jgi:hypothetical protein
MQRTKVGLGAEWAPSPLSAIVRGLAVLSVLLPPFGAQAQQGSPQEEAPTRILRTREIEQKLIKEVSVPGGWFEVSPGNTLCRFYVERGLEGVERDLDWARENRPLAHNKWRIQLAIADKLNVDWKDASGGSHTTTTVMNALEERRCLKAYQTFTELVSTYTAGNLGIETRIENINSAVDTVYPVRPGEYWIPPHNVVSNRVVKEFKPDSIFLFVRPGDIPIPPSLLGATHGSEQGILGAGVTTIHIPELFFTHPDDTPLNLLTVVSLREFMHQVAYSAREVLGYTMLPSVRSAPEYGYRQNDLELTYWMAAVRDHMRTIYPAGFWRQARMGILRQDISRAPAPLIQGRLCDFAEVMDEWPTRLPRLGHEELERITGVGSIEPVIGQFEEGGPCYLFIDLPDSLHSSTTLSEPKPEESALNNQLSLDPRWGLESMAVVRIPGKMDLLFLRMDAAQALLSSIRTEQERPANRCVVGYVSGIDPSEGHPLSFIVAQVDLGPTLPANELEAITRGFNTEVQAASDDGEQDGSRGSE